MSQRLPDLIMPVVSCARCGQDHDRVEFVPLTRPVEENGMKPLTYWAPCPTNGEPILLRVVHPDA